jgi:hypothetical protein
MPLQIRRGTTAQRLSIIPLQGEPIFDTTLNQLFIGDGTTAGGISPDISLLFPEFQEAAVDSVGDALVSGVHKNINFTYGSTQDNLNRIDAEIDLSSYDGEIAATSFKGAILADDNGVIINSANKNINANSVTAISIDTDSLNITSGSLQSDLTGNVTGDLTGNVTGNVTGDVTGDLTGNVTGDVTGDLIGSVFADDSTLLVDATNGTIPGSVINGIINNASLQGNVTGDLTGNVTGDLTGNVTGDLTGNVTGDLTGNVTGDLTGNVTGDLTGNVTGDLTGDLIGSVFADDSTLLVDATNGAINFNGTVKGNIIPDGNELYDIGSPTNKFRDLYLSGTSLNLGSAQITAVGSAIELPAGSTIDGIPIGTGTGSDTGDGVIEGSTYKINIAADDSSIMVDTDLETVTASGGFFGDINSNIVSTQFIDGANSSEVEIRTSLRVKSDLIVENELILNGSLETNIPNLLSNDISSAEITAGNIVANNLSSNSMSSDNISTYFIDPIDSSEVGIRGGLRVEGDLIVENELILLNKIPGPVTIDFLNSSNIFSTDIGIEQRLEVRGNNVRSGILINKTSTNPDSIHLSFTKARNTRQNPAAIVFGDELGRMNFYGYDGSQFLESALISSTVTLGTVSTNQIPTTLNFSVMGQTGQFNRPNMILRYGFTDNSSVLGLVRMEGILAEPSAVLNGSVIGDYSFLTFDGIAFRQSGFIRGTVDGTVGINQVPTRISIHHTDTSGVLRNPLTINSNSSIQINRYNYVSDMLSFDQIHANAGSSNFNFQRSRGTSGSKTTVQSGDEIIKMNFLGFNGTSNFTSSSISSEVVSVDGSNNVLSNFTIQMHDGTSLSTKFILENTGTIDHKQAVLNVGGGSGEVDTSNVVSYMRVKLNGTEYALPLYAINP